MTQCARVLAVLSDRLWHSIEDIHLQAGTMRLNSRVAELRSRGYQIECRKTGGRYAYRLVGKSGVGEPSASSPSSLTGNGAAPQQRDDNGSTPVAASEASPTPEVAAAGHDSPPAPAAAQPSLFDLPSEPAWA